MRILKYRGKLVEETSYTEGNKVVYFKYIKDEDKDKCPHCQKPLDIEKNIVEGCPNWDSDMEGVETLSKDNNNEK